MERIVKIGEREVTIKEVKFGEYFTGEQKSPKEEIKRLIMASAGLSEEEFNGLSLKDGLILVNTVNEVNGLNEEALNFRKRTE